jgi:hypothetical protein
LTCLNDGRETKLRIGLGFSICLNEAAMVRETQISDEPVELQISPEKVCFIIAKAREFDAKDAVTEPDPGSNASDDMMAAILEDHADDPVLEELTSLINDMSEDEQIDLVALAWLGRDDYSAADWPEVRREAARAHNKYRKLFARHADARRLSRRKLGPSWSFLRPTRARSPLVLRRRETYSTLSPRQDLIEHHHIEPHRHNSYKVRHKLTEPTMCRSVVATGAGNGAITRLKMPPSKFTGVPSKQ